MSRARCPHCGNARSKYIQGNGESAKSPNLTLLCVARVAADAWSFDHVKPSPEDFDTAGLVPCGMQWDPNS